MLPEPNALLLDMDDTILDDSSTVDSAWHLACEAAAQRTGLQPEPLLAAIFRLREWYWSDPIRSRTGRLNLRAASTELVQAALASLGIEDGDLAASIANQYRDLRDSTQALFPDSIAALEAFRARGMPLAMLTNGAGPAQRAKIERFDLARHFDAIFIEGEIGAGKPDLVVFQAALKALGREPGEVWMVGDNLDADIRGAREAGIPAVWIDRRCRGLPDAPPARPDRIVRSLAELL